MNSLPRLSILVASTVAALCIATLSVATEPPDAAFELPVGDWAGWAYFDEGFDMPLRVRIECSHEGLTARFDELVNRRYDLPVERVEWTPPTLLLERKRPDGSLISLEGELEGGVLRGRLEWTGHAAEFDLSLSDRSISRTPPSAFDDLPGSYRLEDGGHVVVSSRFWGELLFTRVDTGRFGTLFPVDTDLFFAGSAMYVPSPVHADIRFLRDDERKVTGIEWSEGAKLLRGEKTDIVEEEIEFESDGTRLHGTILRPARSPPLPGVVVLGGSNWTDRETNRRDASILASFGLVTLIYDKRGFGESGGIAVVSFRQTAGDAAAAVRFLAKRPDVIDRQTGLSGRSRSGWIAPLAASLEPDVDFLLLFVPPAVSPAVQETTRRVNELQDAGASPEVVSLVRAMLDQAWVWAETGEGWERYARLRAESVAAGVPEEVLESADRDDPGWEWTRLNMGYDPVPVLETVRVPLLALFGEKDRNVVPQDNLPRMHEALKKAGNVDVRLLVIPDANHGLRMVEEGESPLPHRQIGFGPSGWPEVETWLRSHVDLWGLSRAE